MGGPSVKPQASQRPGRPGARPMTGRESGKHGRAPNQVAARQGQRQRRRNGRWNPLGRSTMRRASSRVRKCAAPARLVLERRSPMSTGRCGRGPDSCAVALYSNRVSANPSLFPRKPNFEARDKGAEMAVGIHLAARRDQAPARKPAN
jgi:hypothetical protein